MVVENVLTAAVIKRELVAQITPSWPFLAWYVEARAVGRALSGDEAPVELQE